MGIMVTKNRGIPILRKYQADNRFLFLYTYAVVVERDEDGTMKHSDATEKAGKMVEYPV